ncbi:MAG: hypothetical protein MR935_01500 [Agathobaculum sp.]|uniref:hypothetical protein n=3 Tax=Agathobaculum sp. TaxID=2048138 RepID=UPI0025C20546|nr:hypothetical protein [Agathobaculum sp.]MCI7124867.1 hypothetical protein [Agathobaculum sp.]
MGFSEHKLTAFDKQIINLPDQPKMTPGELKRYFDSSPEQLRQAHNNLCDAFAQADAAANLGFTPSAGVPAGTVQAAVENVQKQVSAAVLGSIPSGSVTGDKLAQDVRDRLTAIETAAANETAARTQTDTAEATARQSADAAEAAARQSADAAMNSQILNLTNAKCEVCVGTYKGDGTQNRFIYLAKTPKMVFVCTSFGMVYHNSRIYGGLAVTGAPLTVYNDTYNAVEIVPNGFTVTNGGNTYNLQTNAPAYTYHYVAIV